MKRVLCVLLATLPLGAAIFPEQFTTYTRGKVTPLSAPDKELYEEYGFVEAEQAEFSGSGATFKISGWKLKDSTGALALWQLRRPADATASNLAELAAKTSSGVIAAYGNFVFEFQGLTPTGDDWDGLLIQLKKVERSALPTLPNYLPGQGLIASSERYILGPVSLERFAPYITPAQAAFSLSAEGQFGRYRTAAGELPMTILNYPTPNMARERHDLFLKAGAIAKRAGPLVAVIPAGSDANEAERVLARVQYDFELTTQEVGQGAAKGLANIVLTGSLLAVVIIGASLLAALWLGGFKAILKKFGWYKEQDEMTVLRIDPK